MWIVVASTCSRSAPESAGLTSELSLQQAERLASSVTSNGKPSPRQSWRLAWKRKPWLRHLSGATCEPSTAARGVELWIASLAATRANRSASPVSDVGRTIHGTFGRRSLESLRRLNPHCVSSRTSEGTYHSGSTLFGMSFKEWGSELRRDFSRRQKLARRIGGSGCSSWASPTAHNGRRPGVDDKSTQGRNLNIEAASWPTPMAQDGEDAGSVNANMVSLGRAAKEWRTPGANDHKGSAKDGQRRGQLDEATEQKWQTPTGSMIGSRKQVGATEREDLLPLQAGKFPRFLPDQEPAMIGTASCDSIRTSRPQLRARLNPRFVEWLMGWPHGWTDFGRVETGLSLWRRRMRLCLCGLVWRSEMAERK